VLAGEVCVSGKMAATVLQSLAGAGAVAPEEKLSDRELEVMCLFGDGWCTEEIARKLHLSPKTVDVHRAHIKEKLALKSTPEFMRFAIQWANAQGRRLT
jgi:DNA-binding NarL/FixJ family response regulator